MTWVTDLSANRFNNTYFRDAHGTGFAVDMSGDLVVRGNVGIGIDSPSQTLDVDGGIKVKGTGSNTGLTMDGMFYVKRSGNGVSYSSYDHHAFYTNSTSGAETGSERMRIKSNGYVGIGTTNPTFKLHVAGNVCLGDNNHEVQLKSVQHYVKFTNYTTDGTASFSGTRLTSGSDKRLKENIILYTEPSIEKIKQLKPSYYTLKDDDFSTQQLGFIAQDVETVIPEAVDGKKYEFQWEMDESGNAILDGSGNLQFTDTPRYRGFSDRPIIAVIVKAMQEQQEQIELLKTEVAALKNA